jgi:CheY-like chemotaxis protein
MKSKKILIVEDDKFVAEVYLAKLAEMDYLTVLAGNGEEGLRALSSEKFDLILLDILMPIMDGVEMLGEIKKNEKWKDIPVILLTNVGEKDSIEKVRRLGATDYLIKSHFTPSEVIEKIESVFKNS